MNGRRAGIGKSTIDALFEMARSEHQKARGKDTTKQELIDEIDLLLKIEPLQSLGKDSMDFLVDFFKQIKRGFLGLNFNPSDKGIVKAIGLIKKTVTLDSISEDETEKFNFWAGMLTSLVESRKKESRSNWR